ncbi:MAG: 3-isopropylmalate dehydrogenase [Actinobacteria bacterium]|nr:3-isopropylmalate dehydrogenase [Actinomycetota bacterium]
MGQVQGSLVRIAVLPGDGIGPEVIEPALAELPADAKIVRIDAGAERYLATGELVTDADLDAIRDSDALLFGAIGDPRVPDGVLERGVLLRLRKELDLYINLRPFPELGLTFVRENSEGPYAGVGERSGDLATETSINTRSAIERCVRYAFTFAGERDQRLHLVHKTNVMTYAGGLWREVFDEVAGEFPGVETGYEHVDAAAYHLVTDRSRFQVVVTDNLFGDILSDLAAGIDGGLGKAASANLHPDATTRPSRCVGLFEPIHGSAPDIAGTGTADPTAAIRAAQMMLGELEKESAKA